MKIFTITTILCAALLFGCSPKVHTVAGTWKLARPGSPGNSITYIFNSDGKFTYEQHVAYESIHSHQNASGTYTFSRSILTLTTDNESMGIDADTIALIDARERAEDPHLHIAQDKSDVPVKIEQPVTSFRITFLDDSKAKFKDLTNYADHGVTYIRDNSTN